MKETQWGGQRKGAGRPAKPKLTHEDHQDLRTLLGQQVAMLKTRLRTEPDNDDYKADLATAERLREKIRAVIASTIDTK